MLAWLLVASTPATGQDPSRAEQGVATPTLAARAATANARAEAARRYFAGQGTWDAAFPSLVGLDPLDPDAVRAARWARADAATRRAAERVAPIDPSLPAKEATKLRSAVFAACDAEDQADTFDERFLAGLAAALERAPGVRSPDVAAELARLDAARGTIPTDSAPEPRSLAAAEAASALRALLPAVVRAATVPGDAHLSEIVTSELTRLPAEWPVDAADALTAAARQDRLARVRPLLAEPLAEAVARALTEVDAARARAEITALRSAITAPVYVPTDSNARALALADARDDAAAARAAAAAAVDPDIRARAELAAQVADRRAAALEAHPTAVTVADHRAVDEALRLAEDADAAASASATRAERELRAQTAALREEIARRVAEHVTRHDEAALRLDQWRARLDDIAAGRLAARALPPLDGSRQARLDDRYQELVTLAHELQAAAEAQAARRAHALAAGATRLAELDAVAPEADRSVAPAIDAWQAARADLHEALRAADASAVEELDATVILTRAAQRERRAARDDASALVRRETRRQFVPELVAEVRAIPVTVSYGGRAAAAIARALPATLTDLTALVSLAVGSLELLLLVVGWAWLRRRAPDGVAWALEQVRAAESDPDRDDWAHAASVWTRANLEPGDVRALAAPLSRLLAASVDLAAACLVGALLGGRLPLLGLFVWIWLARSAWQAAPALVDTLVAAPETKRPAVRWVPEADARRARRTARAAVAWWAARGIALLVFGDVLVANRLADVASTLGTAALWVGVIGVSWAWAPTVQRGANAEEGRVARWVASPHAAWLRPAQAAVGIAWAVGRALAAAGGHLASSRAGLAWLGAAVARRQLRDAAEADRAPLPDNVRVRLQRADAPVPARAARALAVAETIRGWRQTRRGGPVIVVGDSGARREQVIAGLATDEPIVRLAVPYGTRDHDGVIRWLARALDATDATTAEALAEALVRRPPTVFVLEDLHHTVLRAVGGFDAARAVINLVHATCEEHFWVCTCHDAMWSFLVGARSTVPVQVFREVFQVHAMSANDLAAWIPLVAKGAGFDVTYHGLRAGRPGDARAADREQAAYWRLLAEASQGNPGVALHFFVASLAPGSSDHTVDVGVFTAPSTRDLDGLTDDELFALAALSIHDGLAVDDLARVLNVTTGAAASACRRLELLGVLDSDEAGQWYHTATQWQPAVRRVLRQMSFLQS